MPPDDKVDRERDQRPRHILLQNACATDLCLWSALSFRDRCWRHLTNDEREAFVEEIVRRARSESLEGAHLWSVDLQKADLRRADLRRANLSLANLREARLWNAHLEDACLWEADLERADLSSAHLRRANLSDANLEEADLSMADLEGVNLFLANLQKANLWYASLRNARLAGVAWHGVRYLRLKQIGNTLDFCKGEWRHAEDTYRRLKNYFHEEGIYEDESLAFIMEKTCAKKLAFREKRYLRWAGLLVWNLLAGYGDKWWRTACWATGIITAFAFAYWPNPWGWHGFIRLDYRGPLDLSSFWTSMYLSTMTFASFGFGDVQPANNWAVLVVTAEVLCGYVMLGMLITLIARKMTR